MERNSAATYTRSDRDSIKRDPALVHAAKARARAFLASVSESFGPSDSPDESECERAEIVRLAVADAWSDIDWIEGFENGLADARRVVRGAALNGPGVTPDTHDGWTPSAQRQAAYAAGFDLGRAGRVPNG